MPRVSSLPTGQIIPTCLTAPMPDFGSGGMQTSTLQFLLLLISSSCVSCSSLIVVILFLFVAYMLTRVPRGRNPSGKTSFSSPLLTNILPFLWVTLTASGMLMKRLEGLLPLPFPWTDLIVVLTQLVSLTSTFLELLSLGPTPLMAVEEWNLELIGCWLTTNSCICTGKPAATSWGLACLIIGELPSLWSITLPEKKPLSGSSTAGGKNRTSYLLLNLLGRFKSPGCLCMCL